MVTIISKCISIKIKIDFPFGNILQWLREIQLSTADREQWKLIEKNKRIGHFSDNTNNVLSTFPECVFLIFYAAILISARRVLIGYKYFRQQWIENGRSMSKVGGFVREPRPVLCVDIGFNAGNLFFIE